MSTKVILAALPLMGFVRQGAGPAWTFNAYGVEITCTVGATGATTRIRFPAQIKAGRSTTMNLSQPESLVVLDCVCRLLTQGYAAADIVLERAYTVGHDPKYLDVMVNRGDQPYMMIECKTPGPEYKSEKARFVRNGGQVLTYFAQDRGTEWLVVYTADFAGKNRECEYVGLNATSLTGSNVQDLYRSWDSEVFETGLFSAPPYTFKQPSLKVADLQDMTQKDGLEIFNKFEEVLRRHVVSDKPNAFNKIFNLFICKVFDEQKVNPDEDLEFQWRKGERAEDVLSRLTDLYKKGMREFLKLEVTDHSDSEIASLLANATDESRALIRKAFVELRLYKTNEFAFLDVFDPATFRDNSAIVQDVVRLLQRKRLRYSHKQPFMGDFFERLLNTSVKQESGQFFTPIPIARFILDSLPIASVIAGKLKEERDDFLPYVIDYASGSGHFLTEAMDRVDKVLKTYTRSDTRIKRQRQRANLALWREDYSWASKFVYGIERDYRLAKTAKVSCFLNGDGDANIIRANGLGSFSLSPEYVQAGGAIASSSSSRDNQQFDVVVANPPYSVREFRPTVPHGDESFELWSQLSESSKEIEVLFIERTKQLLRDGGIAGVILPNSILQTGGAAMHARLLLLRFFEIISVVTLGPNTFMKTGIGTIILFLRRRPESIARNVRSSAARIAAGNPNKADDALLIAFADEVLGSDGASLLAAIKDPQVSIIDGIVEDMKAFEAGPGFAKLIKSRDYKNSKSIDRKALLLAAAQEYISSSLTLRIEMFGLVHPREVLSVVAPTNAKEEIRFLGYKFSERRNRSGMQYMSGTDTISTPLFDPDDISSPNKISTLIRARFEGAVKTIPAVIDEYCTELSSAEFIDFARFPFEVGLRTRLLVERPPFIVPTEKLENVCPPRIGGTPSRAKPQYFAGTHPWLSIREMNGQSVVTTTELITDEAIKDSNVKLVKKGTTLVSFKLAVGKTARAGVDLYTNEAIAAFPITPKWVGKVTDDYLFALFTLYAKELLRVEDAHGLKLGTVLNSGALKRVDIPILSKSNMQAFVKAFNSRGIDAREDLRAYIWGT